MKKTLQTIVWKEDKLFVAKFLELELASQGKSKKEALDLYLEDEDTDRLLISSVENVSTQTFNLS